MLSTWRVLREERAFSYLLSASFISGLGDWFNSVAVLGLLLNLTGSGVPIAITLALRSVPYLLLGPFAGVLADRWNRKWILVLSDLARSVLALSFLFVHQTGQIWIVYAGTFGLVAFSALFNPSRMAVIPQLVRESHLVQANALEETISGLVMAIGSMSGGILIGLFGFKVAFIVNAVSFLISALICLPIPVPNDYSQIDRRVDEDRSVGINLSSVQEPNSPTNLWQLIRSSHTVQAMAVLSTLWPIGGGVINVLLSLYAFKVFNYGNTGVGLLYGALGVGFIIGGLVTQRIRLHPSKIVIYGLLLEAAGHIVVSQSSNIFMASGFLMLATIGAGVANVSLNSLIMQSVTKRLHGRVFALSGTTSSIVLSLSMLVTGVMAAHLPLRLLGLCGGLLLVISTLISASFLIPRNPASEGEAAQ